MERKNEIDEVDLLVGRRVRQRRVVQEVRSQVLADAIGVSVAQLQKYEVGKNRISASRLACIARELKTTPEYFFVTDLLRSAEPFVVEVWIEDEVVEVVARCATLSVGQAAFEQATKDRPREKITLRQGREVVAASTGRGR